MWTVYVIGLSRRGYTFATNRGRTPTGLGYVYVGQTWDTPEQRLEHHRGGGSGASSTVRNFGLGLRPELYLGLPPASSEAAAISLERDWACALTEVGFTTRSDGVLRRPSGTDVQFEEVMNSDVEDFFDRLAFRHAARRRYCRPRRAG